MAQMVKHLPTMRETRIRSLGQEDPLEKEMATHSSTLAWKIPWMEESRRLQSMGSQRVELDMTEWLHFHFYTSFIFIYWVGQKVSLGFSVWKILKQTFWSIQYILQQYLLNWFSKHSKVFVEMTSSCNQHILRKFLITML